LKSEIKEPNSVLFTTDIYDEKEIEITEIIDPVIELPVIN
jgi:hypothetical protein